MQTPLSIVFFGTEYLAEAMLQALLADSRFVIRGVVTQPDRPVGRKQILTASPVKQLALSHQIPIFQPEKLREHNPDVLEVRPDFFVVAEFGQLIPEIWRTFPVIDTINVHPSLLPKYRGATPIQSAILNGDAETGVAIMQLEPTMDTGPIISVTTMALDPNDVYEVVEKKLAQLAGPLLQEAIIGLANRQLTPTPQDHAQATLCRKLTRDSGRVDWQRPATEIYNQYRALHRWPGIWTTWNNLRLKLLEIKPIATDVPAGQVRCEHNTIIIGTGQGSILVTQLQLEGRSALTAPAFIQGSAAFAGAQLH